MKFATSSSHHGGVALLVFVCLLFLLPWTIQAQRTTTDPTEAAALNAMFARWRITAASTWNISGDPCSGAAVDSTSFNDNNPFIKCDCNRTTCHITQLKVYAMDVTGPVPDELRSLPQLINLNLAQNFLTGNLPSFIGNFSNMQYMTFGINSLSGTIPKEMGKLTRLISLGLGSNNFSGSLPSEMGNLVSLQEFYIVSAGVGGQIPSTFSQLQNLQTLWASDNSFTGRIPDFIGTLTNLIHLRFQGNSFQGPIPSSLASLTKLVDLRIGDLMNGSSSLAFIQNMTSLSTLVLRNCKISDRIPSNIGTYTNLQMLDLSFNNLSGLIPASLFSLSNLAFLFLGNNGLSGNLPNEKESSLANIDLSYNNFSGSFPAWVGDQNLNINLVANNFARSSSSNSIPHGLDCLQKSIPCNRGSPIWSSFGINCGATRSITSSNRILYEPDGVGLITAASFYVSNPTKWAISNVGRFAESPNGTYVQSSSSQFTNTLNSELFQSARISPSSLRYYGLGLENGNYTVQLQFAETAFENRRSWKSVGRRIFDIYVQGVRVAKDFDIRKEAGGVSFRAVQRSYFANITENFLEIHFFWTGKGTCCIPTQGTYGPLVSAISVTPNFIPTVSNQLPSSKQNRTGLILGLVLGLFVPLLIIGLLIWRKQKSKRHLEDDEELLGLANKTDVYSYAELRTATGDFNPENKLGEGGFGAVYKGILPDGKAVAVKELSITSHQGKQQFVTEIATISAVRHRNLVKLHGCCLEGDKRVLVYEYLENNSLDHALFGKSQIHLDWPSRFSICLGTARGLAYLHEESSVRIVHRDVKASNILLDGDLTPKISDFGLAKLFDDKKTHISTRIAGTIGYLAPEYALRGHLTEKADVFGFGVVALEIISGRANTDRSLDPGKIYLLEWAWHLHENNNQIELIDPSLSSYDKEEVLRLIGVALLCTQTSPLLRPPMSRVVSMLSGDIEVGEVTSRPSYLTEWQLSDSTDFLGSSTIATTGQSSMSFKVMQKKEVVMSPSSTQPMLGGRMGEGQ